MITQEQITSRISQLQAEIGKGEVQLRRAESAAEQIRDAMLRIHGAIEVLSELQTSLPAGGPSATDVFSSDSIPMPSSDA